MQSALSFGVDVRLGKKKKKEKNKRISKDFLSLAVVGGTWKCTWKCSVPSSGFAAGGFWF